MVGKKELFRKKGPMRLEKKCEKVPGRLITFCAEYGSKTCPRTCDYAEERMEKGYLN